ncbi:hypothetical protein [Epilithonimonas arachidiradicis]|uniref:Uncharacterized protein n=1 Tax=Epilithonimonas arachidiradicis TaxID=1617282 RepID=A0A420DDH3_9FLAO|nr:hypothetical protein [Epilithonimonas arachidiradicis]RKE89832.1 hypothetical protein BXY58_0411 [Epilithonimonas arachidiradicis]GGG45636.1 hypothetical protein GCM10007332_03910 [Epilithonimonas arachidiradicis]
MKFWSIITLTVFLNFTALPGLAAMFGWELPRTNVVISEEESHSSNTIVLYEKTIPKTMDIHDFLKFYEADTHNKIAVSWESTLYFPPSLSIFSPPPEA